MRTMYCLSLIHISFWGGTILRDRLNLPRPYEQPGFEPLRHKETRGHSFPSRQDVYKRQSWSCNFSCLLFSCCKALRTCFAAGCPFPHKEMCIRDSFDNGDEAKIEAARTFIDFIAADPDQVKDSVLASTYFPVRTSVGDI